MTSHNYLCLYPTPLSLPATTSYPRTRSLPEWAALHLRARVLALQRTRLVSPPVAIRCVRTYMRCSCVPYSPQAFRRGLPLRRVGGSGDRNGVDARADPRDQGAINHVHSEMFAGMEVRSQVSEVEKFSILMRGGSTPRTICGRCPLLRLRVEFTTEP